MGDRSEECALPALLVYARASSRCTAPAERVPEIIRSVRSRETRPTASSASTGSLSFPAEHNVHNVERTSTPPSARLHNA